MKTGKIYNQFSQEYNELYLRHIHDFQHRYLAESPKDEYFVDFYPSFGIKRHEQCDFLVYGQAVNGWGSGFRIKAKVEPSRLQNSIAFSNEYYMEGNHTPLDWVNVQWDNSTFQKYRESKSAQEFYKDSGYRCYRSFFWNVVYKVISDYYPSVDREGLEWSKKLVWSNLYKIAPDGRNPGYYDQIYQRPNAFELVKKEIEELKPKYCLVITNDEWWAPFRTSLKTQVIENKIKSPRIESLEKYKETLIIVTTRPRIGNNELHVRDILNTIKTHSH